MSSHLLKKASGLLAATTAALLLLSPPAAAQLRTPSLPQLPSLPSGPLDRVDRSLSQTGLSAQQRLDIRELRQRTIRELVRRAPDRIELDAAGEPAVRSEVVAMAPTAAALEAARAAGFSIARELVLEGLGERLVVLRAPAGLNTGAALQRLRTLDPQGQYDYNHVYTRSGTPAAGKAAAAQDNTRAAPQRQPQPQQIRIGLIDGGVDRQHPALREAAVQAQGCGGERTVPSAHGTAVASLLVGRDRSFLGAVPGATLYAADVYCGEPTGGAVDAIAQALAWMARERVPVVNLSLVGPPNRLLERVVAAMLARGHLIVAAVGNDGPAAPPLYPAAYAGVVAVTGVDGRRRVLPEAGQGPHVVFAAPGAELAVAASADAGYLAARGTSFAAPLVAGLLAMQLRQPDPAQTERAVSELAATAFDLGSTGRDSVYGHGLVGQAFRIDPAKLARADDAAAQRLSLRQ